MKFRSVLPCLIAVAIATFSPVGAHSLNRRSSLVAKAVLNKQLALEKKSEATLISSVGEDELEVRGGAASEELIQTLKIGFYFAAWYALNIVYNSTFWFSLSSAFLASAAAYLQIRYGTRSIIPSTQIIFSFHPLFPLYYSRE